MRDGSAPTGDRGRATGLARGSALTVGSRAAVLLVVLATTPFVIDVLGPETYGAWIVVVGVAGLLGVVDVGFAPALGRVVAHALARDDRRRAHELVATALAGNLLVGILLGGLAWVLAPHFAGAVSSGAVAGLEPALRLAAVTAVLVNAAGVVDGALIGAGRIGALALARILYAALFGGGVALVLVGGGTLVDLAWAQLAAWAVAIAFAAIWMGHALGGGAYSPLRVRPALTREILRYGAPPQASRLALIGALQYERLMVAALVGVTAAAGYGVASLLAGGLRMLLGQATVPLIPALTALAATEGLAATRAAYERALRHTAVVFAGCFGALAASAPLLVAAWVGPGFEDAPRFLWILTAGFAVSAYATACFALAQAVGRPGIEARTAAVTAAFYVVPVAVLLAAFGAAGAAVGTALGLVVGGVYCFLSLARSDTAPLPSVSTAILPGTTAALVAVPLAFAGSRLVADGSLGRPSLALAAVLAGALHLTLFTTALVALSRVRLEAVRASAIGGLAVRAARALAVVAVGLLAVAVASCALVWPTLAVLVLTIGVVGLLAWRAPAAAFVVTVVLFGVEGALKLGLDAEGVPIAVAPDAIGAALLDLALVLAVLGVVVADRLRTPRLIWAAIGRTGRIGLALIGLWLALSPLHLALAPDLRTGLEGFRLTQFYVLALPAAAILFGRSAARTTSLVWALLGGFVLVAGYAAVRAVVGPSEAERVHALSQDSVTEVSTAFRAVGSFSSTVGLESYLVPVVGFGMVLALLSGQRRVAVVVALAGGVALVGSYGRAPIVAVGAVALAVGAWLVFGRAAAVRRRLALALVLGLAMLAVGGGVVVAATVNEKAGERAKGLIDPLGDESMRLRLETWESSLDTAVRDPAGQGLGRVGDASGETRESKRETDNAFLKVLVEQGALGALAFVAGILALMAGAWRRLVAAGAERAAVGIAALAGCAGFLLLATTGEFFEQPGKVVFWTLLGAALGQAAAVTSARTGAP